MPEYKVDVQSLNFREAYDITALTLLQATVEGVMRFNRAYTEAASAVQAEANTADINDINPVRTDLVFVASLEKTR